MLATALVLLAQAAAHPAPHTLPALIHQADSIAAQLADGCLEQQVSDHLEALAAPGPPAAGAAPPLQPPPPAADTAAPRALLDVSHLRCALDWQLVVLATSLLGQQQQQQGVSPFDGGSSGGEQAAPPAMQAPPLQVAVSQQQLEHARAAADAAAQRLSQQEPYGPRCHYATGLAALHPRARSGSHDSSSSGGSQNGSSSNSGGAGLSAAQHFLRAAELGLQHGSPVWAAAGAAAALQHAPTAPLAERQSTARAALEAASKAQAALQAGSKGLPPGWVHSLSACLDSAKAEGQLLLNDKVASSGTGAASAAVPAAMAPQAAGKPAKGAAGAAPLLLPHQRADPPGARAVARERADKQQLWLTVCLDSCLLFCLTVCCESCLGACCEGCFNACCGACCGT